MALNGNQMGNEVADAILALSGSGLSTTEQNTVRIYWQTICTAIVNHITTNGHAVPGTFLDSIGGALTGEGDIE